MIRAITVNRLKPLIDRSFGLEAITAAFEYYQAQSHFGKISIEI
jgi:NADPH:quinone reductase-like Zn-dependent oxidoreductase